MNKKSINIKLSDDKLAAFITIDAKPSAYPEKVEINETLAENGVVFGIDEAMINDIVKNKKNIANAKIASGTMPVKGKNAQLIWHLEDFNNSEKVVFDETGLADYKHARSFCEVREGDEIVSKLPGTQGRDGKTVTGETVASAGRDISLPIGENVKISEDGLTLVATVSGLLNFCDGKIEISNVYRIEGDVSFNTGNINYDGKVIIQGDVRSGFRVEATDTIIVEGDAEAANIRSKNGDVIIKMGVLGKGRAKILAGRNVRCGFIQDTEVKSGKDVIVEHYIINSDVYSGGMVKVAENEGLIRGGKIFGEKGIIAKEAGSPRNISTTLGIGLNKNEDNVNELNKIIHAEDELFMRYELISKKERFLKLLLERVGKLSQEKQDELDSISKELNYINAKLAEIDVRKREMSQKSGDIGSKHKIIITDKLHKGVLLYTGANEFYIDKLYEKVMIFQDLDNIIIDDLKSEEG
ncbi:MAG: DUF342 domain-containing protein [Candidatus Marinimicrobia bacterium]|nr:DUF342 domain-containing protein [Candidatus Neomarinimicrobiota bacterium]